MMTGAVDWGAAWQVSVYMPVYLSAELPAILRRETAEGLQDPVLLPGITVCILSI